MLANVPGALLESCQEFLKIEFVIRNNKCHNIPRIDQVHGFNDQTSTRLQLGLNWHASLHVELYLFLNTQFF